MTPPWDKSAEGAPDVVAVQSAQQGFQGTVFVSPETARAIEAQLDQTPPPNWITFHDVCGGRVHTRSSAIICIEQATAEQRAANRAFHRALHAEAKAEKGWED